MLQVVVQASSLFRQARCSGKLVVQARLLFRQGRCIVKMTDLSQRWFWNVRILLITKRHASKHIMAEQRTAVCPVAAVRNVDVSQGDGDDSAVPSPTEEPAPTEEPKKCNFSGNGYQCHAVEFEDPDYNYSGPPFMCKEHICKCQSKNDDDIPNMSNCDACYKFHCVECGDGCVCSLGW